MKFQKIVIAMLSLLLILNAVGIGVIIKEEKAQTEIALYHAAITINKDLNDSNKAINNAEGRLWNKYSEFFNQLLE